jgi:hypothetical protein
MERLQSFFDYIFYRIYKFSKARGDIAAQTNGTLLLSLMQFLTILDIVVLIRIVYPFPLPGNVYVIPLIALPAIVNWLRYERNFDIGILDLKWRDEDQRKKLRNGWFIGIYLAVALLIPVVHGYLEHNLKVI